MTASGGLRRFVRSPQEPGNAAAPAHPAAGAAAELASVPDRPGPPAPSAAPPSLSSRPGLSVPAGAGQARAEAAPATEKCEFCAAQVADEHGHVADLETATLICACRPCYLLFTHGQAGRGRYRSVPDRYARDPDRIMTVAEWDSLEIPVGLAFFLRSSQRGQLSGFYPSPAGVTECILDLQEWDRLAAAHPLLGAPAPDVEAALICRTDGGVEYFVVPIDACYELAGRMRLHWRGFDGGAEGKASIAEFLASVRSRARAVSPAT